MNNPLDNVLSTTVKPIDSTLVEGAGDIVDDTVEESSEMFLPFYGTKVEPKILSLEDYRESMDLPDPRRKKVVPPQQLLLRTFDGNHFRVYMTANQIFTQQYLVSLQRFLDSRSPENIVTFVLGTKMRDSQAHMLGGIISAMESCPAQVNTIAAGYCSIPETMLWCAGKNRDVFRYGALSFCTTEFISVCEKYKAYFEVFLNKAKEIGVITPDEVDHIWKTGREVMITYNDYNKRFNRTV